MYDIYCDFDLEKHMEKYINYLEVIILPTGKVVYAVPSHQEMLIKIAMKKYMKTRTEIEEMCPEDMYCLYMDWLLSITDCVAVWSQGYIGNPNRFQKNVLKKFKDNKLIP